MDRKSEGVQGTSSTGQDSRTTLDQRRREAVRREKEALYSQTLGDKKMLDATWSRYYEPLCQHLKSKGSVQIEEMHKRWYAYTTDERFRDLQSLFGIGSEIENHILYRIQAGRINPEVGNEILKETQKWITDNIWSEIEEVKS